MPFVNEFVSVEDIKTYDLEALHIKWWRKIPYGFQYAWTIDKKRECYYIPMRSGREEYANQTRGVFYFQGIHWDVEVSLEPGGSLSFSDNPYRLIWGLIDIKHPDGDQVPRDNIIPVLKGSST